MLQVQAGFLIQDHAGIVRGRARAVGRETQLAGVGLDVSQQLLEVIGSKTRRAHQHHAGTGNGSHRPHILDRVEAGLHHVRNFGQDVAGGDHDGLAIGRRRHHGLHRDGTAGTGFVVNDHGLPDIGRQLVGQDARHHVHGAAGRGWHQHLDGLVGPGQRQRANSGSHQSHHQAAQKSGVQTFDHRCLLLGVGPARLLRGAGCGWKLIDRVID